MRVQRLSGLSLAIFSWLPAAGSVAEQVVNEYDDVEMAAVLSYIRQEYGNGAPPITVERVAAVREQVPGPEPSVDPR